MKLSLAVKNFFIFILVIVFFAGASFYTVRRMQGTVTALYAVHEGYLPLTRIAAELETAQKNRLIDLEKILEADDPMERGVLVRLVLRYFPQVFQKQVGQGLAHCGKMALVTRDPDLLKFTSRITARLKAVGEKDRDFSQLAESILDSKNEGGEWRLNEKQKLELKSAERAFAKELKQLSALLDQEVSQSVTRIEAEADRAMWTAAVLTFVALGLAAVLTLLSFVLLKPLRGLTEAVRAISRGEYDSPVRIDRNDELGVLAGEFDKMRVELARREKSLQEKRDELARALKEVQSLNIHNENILNNLRLGVLVADDLGLLRSFNPAAAVLLGDAPANQMERPVKDLPLSNGSLSDLFDLPEVLTTRQGRTAFAVPMPGSVKLDVTALPFIDGDGFPRGLMFMVDDVTEKLAVAAKLLHSERLAAIGRITTRITHEIRNPLSAIGLNVEMLQDELTDFPRRSDVEPLLRTITREVERLHGITEDYLRFARLPTTEPAPFDLRQAVDEVSRLLSPELARRKIELRLEMPMEPAMAPADENQLVRALQNLMRNAMEAMPGGGSVMVTIRPDGKEFYVLEIADRGESVPEELREKIWEPFFSTKQGGTGLGLAMARRIAEEHDGVLLYAARQGGGSVFSIRLPALKRKGG